MEHEYTKNPTLELIFFFFFKHGWNKERERQCRQIEEKQASRGFLKCEHDSLVWKSCGGKEGMLM